jgi:hypothetical protein
MTEYRHVATNVQRPTLDCLNDGADVVRVRHPTWERGAMADTHYGIRSILGKALRQSLPCGHLPTR